MQQAFLLIAFVVLIALTTLQSLGQFALWYSPFLMALTVIILSALIQQDSKHDGS